MARSSSGNPKCLASQKRFLAAWNWNDLICPRAPNHTDTCGSLLFNNFVNKVDLKKLVKGADGLGASKNGPLRASFSLADGSIFFLKNERFWEATRDATGALVAKGDGKCRDIFVDIFGCQATSSRAEGICISESESGSPSLSPAAATGLLLILHFTVWSSLLCAI